MKRSKMVNAAIISIIIFSFFCGCELKDNSTEPDGSIPAVPVLITPVDSALNVTLVPTFVWGTSFGAVSYTLQVSLNNSFSNFVYNQSGITGTNQLVAGLGSNKVHYWRVNAVNDNGTSAWSSVRSFTSANGNTACLGITTVTYSGKTYNTVAVGTQCWFKENLNVGTMIQGAQAQSDNGTIEKYCYNNVAGNCDIYGGLYLWSEAMQYVTTSGAKGICPAGWHIPSKTELETLQTAVNSSSNALKSVGQGSGNGAGTNTSGFSGLLAGSRNTDFTFSNLGYSTGIWGSTELGATFAYNFVLEYYGSAADWGYFDKENGFSIRCIKN